MQSLKHVVKHKHHTNQHLYLIARVSEKYTRSTLQITFHQNKRMAHPACYLLHVLINKEGDFDRTAMRLEITMPELAKRAISAREKIPCI